MLELARYQGQRGNVPAVEEKLSDVFVGNPTYLSL